MAEAVPDILATSFHLGAVMTAEERFKNFEVWLMAMPDALETWMAGLPTALSQRLDYSLESLTVLEEWLLSTFPSPREAVGGDNFAMGDGAARYVGETLRRHFKGHWDMDVHDPKGLFFGVPCLRGFVRGGIPVVPLRVVVNALAKRTGGYFASVAKHMG